MAWWQSIPKSKVCFPSSAANTGGSSGTDSNKVIVVLDHECRMPEAMRVLSTTCGSRDIDVVQPNSVDEGAMQRCISACDKITIVAPTDDEGNSEVGLIESIIASGSARERGKEEADTNYWVIHSSLATLQKLKRLFGDDSPILKDGFGRIPTCKTKQLGLFLPNWSDCTSVSQQNDAIMDPWLSIIDSERLAALENDALLSASYQ